MQTGQFEPPVRLGDTEITAWTHRVCLPGNEEAHIHAAGWRRVPIPGKTWRSGAQAFTWSKQPDAGHQLELWARTA